MKLTNFREVEYGGTKGMAADFVAEDGRLATVSVPIEEYRAHGEAALESEALACQQWARTHLYRPTAQDRYTELQ